MSPWASNPAADSRKSTVFRTAQFFLLEIITFLIDGYNNLGYGPSIEAATRWSEQMAKPVTHLSRIRTIAGRTIGGRTITGTICNRMAGNGDINCTTDAAEVTCKLCLRELSYQTRKPGAALTTNQMVAMFAQVLA